MSYSFDTLMRAWRKLEAQLPPETQSGEVAFRFNTMLEEIHEANHRLNDAVNHDARVTKCAMRLDAALTKETT